MIEEPDPNEPTAFTPRGGGNGSSSSRPGTGRYSWEPPPLATLQAWLSQYQFLELLGCGGMAAVYKAVQISLNRVVAIKVLPFDVSSEDYEQFMSRFRLEAQTMARLNHPGIVSVYDFGEAGGSLLYFVMEFVDGTDVARMIKTHGRLPEDHALAITAHVCDALHYAHKHGVIHRDIKPANVLINQDGQVKVADFGLAKVEDPEHSGISRTDVTVGTPDFVAPETLITGTIADHRADLYAVGVMLYNMLTGQVPRGLWTMPSVRLGIDPRFDSIIMRAMQADREERYQSAKDLRRDLDTILSVPKEKAAPDSAATATEDPAESGSEPPSGPKARAAPRSTHHSHRSKRRGAAKDRGVMFAGIGAVALICGGLFFVTGRRPPAPHAIPLTITATEVPESSPSGAKTSAPASAPAKIDAKQASPPRAAPGNSQEMRFDGHRYQFVRMSCTWEQASARANSMNGHLTTISNRREHDFLTKALATHLLQGEHLWIGAWRVAGYTQWRWVTNELLTYQAWGARQPDLSQDIAARATYVWDGATLRWDDLPAEDLLEGFIIEWESDPVAPSPAPLAAPKPVVQQTPPPTRLMDTDPRLRQLEAGFKARYDTDVQKPYEAALAALNQSYVVNGIARAKAASYRRGTPEEVPALDAEAARVQSSGPLPSYDPPTVPASLKELRDTYRTALAKLEADRIKKATPLYDIYLGALDAYSSELTKTNKSAEAQEVNSLRDEIAARKK